MLKMMKPTTRARAKTKMARARMNWKWNLGKARARKNWWQFRMKRKLPGAQSGVIGSILGGAAGLLALAAVASSLGRRKLGSHPQSGQAPGRRHIQRFSHPAAESRFQSMKKMFAKA